MSAAAALLERAASSRAAVREAFLRGLRPDPRITVSEWADRHRLLTRRSSSEPGPWRTSRTPYLREIMDCLSSSSPVQTVVFMKGSQVGGTEVLNNWIGYVIDHAPGPTMLVMPTEGAQRKKSRQTLDALIEDTPQLAQKVAGKKSRDPGNTTLMKVFPGGMLVLASAQSGAELRSTAIRNLALDEIDAYPEELPGEGDPDELAERGTHTFPNRKIYRVSTPTVEGRSRIDRHFEETDRRYYHVPCPFCGQFQRIEWKRKNGRRAILWDQSDDDLPDRVILELRERTRVAWMECEHCAARIDEHHKDKMLEGGVWIPEDPSLGERVRGYHLSALYSPHGMYSWTDSAVRFLRAQGAPSRLRVWVNQDLGETWKEKGEAPDWRRLWELREAFTIGVVPRGGVLLTAGVDVQADRFEYEVVAWGPGLESWSVQYVVFPCDPTKAESWVEIDRLMQRTFPFAAGGPPGQIAGIAVDTGHEAQKVYLWARRYGRSGRLFLVKGRTNTGTPIGTPTAVDVEVGGRRLKRGVRLWPIDVSIFKQELYENLELRPPVKSTKFPEGYCHFPQYGADHFKQLTAEMLIQRRLKDGRSIVGWEKLRERNEALDCFDPKTEVLTRTGWRNVSGLDPDCELATIHLPTDEIQYQHPVELIARRHQGEMVSIEGRRISILVTPGHRMVTYLKKQATIAPGVRRWNFDVAPEITRAEDLTIHHALKITGTWAGEDVQRIHLQASLKPDGSQIEPARELDPGDWAEFLGWWVAEGSARENAFGKSIRRVVSLSQNRGPKLDRIVSLLERLPWKFRVHASHGPSSPARKLVVSSKQLHDEVVRHGRLQPNRRAPQWIKDAPPSIVARFIDAMVAGDGWTQGRARTIATTSPLLADDLQELFIKLGRAANVHVRAARPYSIGGRSGDNTVDQYRVSECRAARAYLDGGGGGRREFIGRRVEYEGMVYCASVPNGTLICRRNGQSFVAGNCRVYARAAACILGADRFSEHNWEEVRGVVEKSTPATPLPPEAPPPAPTGKPPEKRRRTDSRWERFRK